MDMPENNLEFNPSGMGPDRRSILKALGIGAAGIAASPFLSASMLDSAAAATSTSKSRALNFTAWEYQPDTIKALVAAWSKKSGVKVATSFIPNVGYTAGIQSRQRGGKPADAFYNFAYNSQKFVQQKWAADLRGLKGADQMVSEMFPSARSRFVATNGAIVSVPYFSAVHMLQYNKKMVAAAGFSGPPNSLQETYDQCKKIKENGVGAPYLAYWVKDFVEEYLHVYLLAGNVVPFDSKGNPVFMDDPKTLDVFNWWQSMYKDGMTPKSVLTDDPGKETTQIANGNAAFFALHHYFLRDIVESKGTASADITQAKIVGTGGKTLQMGEVVQMGGHLSGATKLAAWDFLKTYGWKDSSGQFSTAQKWAKSGALAAPYPAFFADPKVKASFPSYMDLNLIKDTFEHSSDIVPARTLPWYQGFQAQCGVIIHDLLLGNSNARATANALAIACRTAKSGAGL
jgi:multiple sugar transport system substrate-binding protein